MPGRNYNSNSYKYGHGGQEKDDEVTGVAGSHLTAEYWEYDTRLGRRWNVDPIIHPWQSPFATFNNNPIYFADPRGLQGEETNNPPKDPKDGQTWNTTDKNGVTWSWEYVEGVGVVGGGGTATLGEVTVVAEKTSFWNKVGNWFSGTWNSVVSWGRRLDHKLDWGSDNHTGRDPVRTRFGGFQQVGSGGNKNQHIYGLPDFNDESYTPGSIAGGIENQGKFDKRKDIDDWDDPFDDDLLQSELGKTLADGANSVVDNFIDKNQPVLKISTDKSTSQQTTQTANDAIAPKDYLVPDPKGGYTYKYHIGNGEYGTMHIADDWQASGVVRQNKGNVNFIFIPSATYNK